MDSKQVKIRIKNKFQNMYQTMWVQNKLRYGLRTRIKNTWLKSLFKNMTINLSKPCFMGSKNTWLNSHGLKPVARFIKPNRHILRES